jgi:hypothetical protein
VAHGKVQYTARTHTIGGAYFLQARLNVSLPGLERGVAQALVDAAHEPVRIPKPRAATSTLRSSASERDL